MCIRDSNKPIPQDIERRRDDTRLIAQRQKGIYPYDINVDIREPGPDEPMPIIHDLYDGQQFDLEMCIRDRSESICPRIKFWSKYLCPSHPFRTSVL